MVKDKTTDWTYHQLGEQIVRGNEQKKEYNAIKVELLKYLPVPKGNILFSDILEFKETRKDELLALHSAIDDMYLNIITSPDKDLQSKKSILEFQKKLENLNKVSNERFKFLSKYNLTTELNLNGKDLTTAIAGGAVF